jgi:tight adherence protein B
MKLKSWSPYIFGFGCGYLVAKIATGSTEIALPFGLVSICIPVVLLSKREVKAKEELASLWPEILDHLISGLHSGLSLAETIAGLSIRGPERSKSIFALFESELRRTGDFGKSIYVVKSAFNDSTADQVCETLIFARSAGSRDTALTLRTLSNFIRTDMALRREIVAKHSWVKNSAALAAVAPWILLLLLASQPNTVAAYSRGSGPLILVLGALLTGVAYFWMDRVGRLKNIPRVFT